MQLVSLGYKTNKIYGGFGLGFVLVLWWVFFFWMVGFWLGFFGKARQLEGNTLNCSARNHEVSEPEG